MKITLLTPALAAVLGCALACAPVTVQAQAAAAAPTGSPDVMSSKEKADYVSYAGKITAMDDKSITIETSKGTMTMMVDQNTKYMLHKKKAKMSDFAVGDKVTGSYEKMSDGSFMLHSIHKKQGTKNP